MEALVEGGSESVIGGGYSMVRGLGVVIWRVGREAVGLGWVSWVLVRDVLCFLGDCRGVIFFVFVRY